MEHQDGIALATGRISSYRSFHIHLLGSLSFYFHHATHLLILCKEFNAPLSFLLPLSILQYISSFSLAGLNMTTALGYYCKVSVETVRRRSQWFLVLTLSISDYLPCYAGDHSALQTPCVTFEASQNPHCLAELVLPPLDGKKSKWRGTCQVPVDSELCPREFTVKFWHRWGTKWGEAFNLAVWDVEVSVTPTVSHQMSSSSSQD